MRTVIACSGNNGYAAFKRHEHCDVHVNEPGSFRIGVYTLTLDDRSKTFRCSEHLHTHLTWPPNLIAPKTVRVAKPRLQAEKSLTCVVCDQIYGPGFNLTVPEGHLCVEHQDYVLVPYDDRGDVEIVVADA